MAEGLYLCNGLDALEVFRAHLGQTSDASRAADELLRIWPCNYLLNFMLSFRFAKRASKAMQGLLSDKFGRKTRPV